MPPPVRHEDATRASQGANKEWATIAEWHEASPTADIFLTGH